MSFFTITFLCPASVSVSSNPPPYLLSPILCFLPYLLSIIHCTTLGGRQCKFYCISSAVAPDDSRLLVAYRARRRRAAAFERIHRVPLVQTGAVRVDVRLVVRHPVVGRATGKEVVLARLKRGLVQGLQRRPHRLYRHRLKDVLLATGANAKATANGRTKGT